MQKYLSDEDNNLTRVCILGHVGHGKSTLAEVLQQIMPNRLECTECNTTALLNEAKKRERQKASLLQSVISTPNRAERRRIQREKRKEQRRRSKNGVQY